MKNLLCLLTFFILNIFTENSFTSEYSKKYLERTPPLEVFYAIQKYSSEYDIPRNYAYGIAYIETKYTGPFDYNYDHRLTSSAGALGPMQVMYPTAKAMWPEVNFTKEDLKNDIDFNVKTSMKFLRHLHNKYGNWEIVMGCYNTGKPVITNYSKFIVNYQPSFI